MQPISPGDPGARRHGVVREEGIKRPVHRGRLGAMAHHGRPFGVVAVGQPALPRQVLAPLLPPLLGVHLQALHYLRPPAGEH